MVLNFTQLSHNRFDFLLDDFDVLFFRPESQQLSAQLVLDEIKGRFVVFEDFYFLFLIKLSSRALRLLFGQAASSANIPVAFLATGCIIHWTLVTASVAPHIATLSPLLVKYKVFRALSALTKRPRHICLATSTTKVIITWLAYYCIVCIFPANITVDRVSFAPFNIIR